jgi:hypothetical protein
MGRGRIVIDSWAENWADRLNGLARADARAVGGLCYSGAR